MCNSCVEEIKVINGKRCQYYDFGSGDDCVVLLHSAGVSKDSMLGAAEEIGHRFRYVIPDLPGHNGVPFDDVLGARGIVLYVKDLLGFLNLKRYYVLGFSLGGLIALKYSEVFSTDKGLRGVVIWASPIRGINDKIKFVDHLVKILPNPLYNFIKSPEVLKVASKIFNTPITERGDLEALEKFNKDSALKILGLIENEEYKMANNVRKLFIFGTDDPFVPNENYLYLKDHKPKNSKVVLIKNGGHNTSKEGEVEVIAVIQTFLRGEIFITRVVRRLFAIMKAPFSFFVRRQV